MCSVYQNTRFKLYVFDSQKEPVHTSPLLNKEKDYTDIRCYRMHHHD